MADQGGVVCNRVTFGHCILQQIQQISTPDTGIVIVEAKAGQCSPTAQIADNDMVKPGSTLDCRVKQAKLVKCPPAIWCKLNATSRGCRRMGTAQGHPMTGIGGGEGGTHPGNARTADHDRHSAHL